MRNPFQPSIAFHIETSHFISAANQITGFYMKCKTGMKWVKNNWLNQLDFLHAEMLRSIRVDLRIFRILESTISQVRNDESV